MNRPWITIITPTFNNDKTLYDTVRSVLSQNYPNIEYIIVNDGSNHFDSDRITGLSNSCRPDITLKIISNEYNIGTVKSLNKAIRNSSGKYIFNIAADDCFNDDDVISNWVDEFEKTDYMVITGLRDVYDPEMKVCLRTDPPKKVKKLIAKEDPSLLFHAMIKHNLIIGCCTAYSRKCIEKYGLFDEKYPYIEDYPRYLSLSRNGVPIHLFERVVIKYRIGGISSSENIDERYEKESDDILKNEILPYVEDSNAAISLYNSWKRRNHIKKDFTTSYFSTQKKTLKISCLIKYGLKDPKMVALFLHDAIKVKVHH